MYRFALNNLTRRPFRTGLTIFGISIGISLIVVLVSVSLGLESEMSGIIGKMQGIIVLQKGAVDDSVSVVDKNRQLDLEKISGVYNVIPYITGMPEKVEDVTGELSAIMGVSVSDNKKSRAGGVWATRVIAGRFLKDDYEQAVVLGKTLADKFNKKVGEKIKINDKEYLLVGIVTTGSELTDIVIITPLSLARVILGFSQDMVSMFYVEPETPEISEKLSIQINSQFPDITAKSTDEYSKEYASLFGTITTFTWLISAIAAIVAGVGIANTMLMSVIEQTKEFGVLKAVGWYDKDVMYLVFAETILLSLFGGIIGLLLGSSVVYFVIPLFIKLPQVINLQLVIQSIGFSLALGFFGALYPVYRVSLMLPTEAFREE